MKAIELQCQSCRLRDIITEDDPRNHDPSFYPFCEKCGSFMRIVKAQEVGDG